MFYFETIIDLQEVASQEYVIDHNTTTIHNNATERSVTLYPVPPSVYNLYRYMEYTIKVRKRTLVQRVCSSMSFYHMHRFMYHHNQDAELVHHPKEATGKSLCLPSER